MSDSSAQYAIDIASKMDGGTETLSQLDDLTAKLTGGGKNASFFQDAISKLAKELQGASAASVAANAALSAGEEEYARLERALMQVTKAAEKASLKNSGIMPPEATAWVQRGSAALAAQADKLRVLETAAKKASDSENALTKTQKNLETLNGHVNKSLLEQSERFEKLRGALSASGGPLGQLASKALAPAQSFAKLSASMGATRASAIIATVGVAALVAALVAGGTAAFAWGIKLADSARSAGLSAAATQAMHPELAALAGVFGEVSRATNMHVGDLQDLADKLKDAKVAVKDMPSALRAAALAETALGKSGSQEFIDKIKSGTVEVGKFSSETQAQLGGIVAKQMLGLSAQGDRLSNNLSDIFGSLDIEPFLKALSVVVGLFDKDSASGQALKFVFKTLFQPVIDFAPKAAVEVEALFLALEIGALKAYLAIKHPSEGLKAFGVVVVAAGAAFVATLIPALLATGAAAVTAGAASLAALAPVAVAAFAAAAPFLAIGAAVLAVYEAFQHWTEIQAMLSGIVDMVSQIGGQIIDGIVAGVTNAAGALISAIGGAVGGAIDHAKKLLGIASPSKVFASIGDNTVAGFTGSVEDGASAAQTAVAAMVEPPSPEALKQAALSGDLGALSSPADSPSAHGAKAPGGGAATVSDSGGSGGNFAGAQFNFYGVEGAEDALARFKSLLTLVVEGDAISLGANLAGAA